MKIKDKIRLTYNGLVEHGPITIVAFGDSVTHGAFEIGEIDYESVYWNILRNKILAVSNYVPVNVINAGIGGINAKNSIERMEKQVIAHNPDLVIACFGLNDINGPIEEYISSLETIFARCRESDTDVIFMTPNMLNTYVADDVVPEYKDYAGVTAEYQNSGKMDIYMDAARELAKKMNIAVCDCYAEWKKLSETQDVTMLLINRINHPTREMHELFAQKLFDMIFEGTEHCGSSDSNTMYRG